MQTSEQIADLCNALVAAQSEIRKAEEDSSNPYHKSSYASLSAVFAAFRSAFAAQGLAVLQAAETAEDGGKVAITTRLVHSSGQWIETRLDVPIGQSKNPTQAMGSAITYGRRYALSALAGVASGKDDDGEANRVEQTGSPRLRAVPTYTHEQWKRDLGAANVTEAQVDAFRQSKGKPPCSSLSAEQRQRLGAWLVNGGGGQQVLAELPR